MDKLTVSDAHHNSSSTIYTEGDLLYKFFDNNNYEQEIERNIDYLINNPLSHTPKIYKKIYKNDNFAGYVMGKIDGMTFRQAINNNFSYDDKIKAITDVYDVLKFLHHHKIIIGDIHSDNFMISTLAGYVIDLDEMRFTGDEYKFNQCYIIKINNNSYKIPVPSVYTDNIKTMISALSLLLDIDLEKYISPKSHCINLEEIYNLVILPLNIDYLNDYFKKIIYGENVEYFDELLLKNYNQFKR
jgi:serine/threonine protein kinase